MISNDMNHQFRLQLEQLLKDGIFHPDTHTTATNARYLFISSGGTGLDALAAVKDALKTHLTATELEKFRFIAVDTDRESNRSSEIFATPDGKTTVREIPLLDERDFFLLSPYEAKNIISMPTAATPDWLEPNLVHQFRGQASCLVGHGVDSVPQLARLCLWTGENSSRLRQLLQQKIHELKVGANPLYIFYLSGLSGGTGAGTVIDLPYLIRASIPAPLHHQAQLCGFLLMPSTGFSQSADRICRGNAIGYAALKEADHFMGLSTRDETYTQQYADGYTVISRRNLFDSCYLLEGNSTYIFNNNSRKHALQLLAKTILDLVSSAVTLGGTVCPAATMLVTDSAFASASIVANHSVKDMPRNVSYVYSTLGHHSVSFPIHELRAYVAKRCFDQMQNFIRSNTASALNPQAFLREILSMRPSPNAELCRAIDLKLRNIFLDPHYLQSPCMYLDFLHQVREEAERLLARSIPLRPYFARSEVLECIIRYLQQGPETSFSAFAATMDGMQRALEHQFSDVVTTQSGQITLKCLAGFSGNCVSTQCVMDYLDRRAASVWHQKILHKLYLDMVQNSDDWAALFMPDETDPGRGIRAISRFWNRALDEILPVTMEDLLIKLYSGNPDARFDPANPAASLPALQAAAKSLFHVLTKSAESEHSVSFTSPELWLHDFRCHPILTVPKDAPNLYNELCSYAAHMAASVRIISSDCRYRIGCCQQFCGFPAMALNWTCCAEADYESQLMTYDIHSSSSFNGISTTNLPNLIPPNHCGTVHPFFLNAREIRLAELADSLLRTSHTLGLTQETILPFAGLRTTGVKILPPNYRPSDALFVQLEQEVPGSAAWQELSNMLDAETERCARELFPLVRDADPDHLVAELENRGVVLNLRNLLFPGIAIHPAPTDDVPDWDLQFAAMMLRTLPLTMRELDATLRVVTFLRDQIIRIREQHMLISNFARYLTLNFFCYSKAEDAWLYRDSHGFLRNLPEVDSDLAEEHPYFLLFRKYREMAADMDEAMAVQTEQLLEDTRLNEGDAGIDKLQARIQEHARHLQATLKNSMRQLSGFHIHRISVQTGCEQESVQDFYRLLLGALGTIINCGLHF